MSASNRRTANIIVVVAAIIVMLAGVAIVVISTPLGDTVKDKLGLGREPTISDVVPATNKPIGAGVLASGDKVPTALKAEETTITPPHAIKGVTSLGKVLDITPHGKLPDGATMTLTFTFPKAVAKGQDVVVAMQPEGGEWTYLSATLAPDRKSASVQTNHLSKWWPFGMTTGELLSSIAKSVIDAVTDGMTARVTKIDCDKKQAANARTEGYTFDRPKSPYLTCFSKRDGKDRTVTIVNPYRYAVVLTPSKSMHLVEPPKAQVKWANLGSLGRGKQTVLFPFDSATYSVKLDEDASATLRTAYDGWAQNFARLDIAMQSLLAIYAKFGGGAKFDKWDDYIKELNTLLAKTGCLNAVAAGDGGKIITSCFDWSTLTRLFGKFAAILAPFTAVASFVNWLRGELNSLGDQLNGRDRIKVTVSRASSFQKFVGTWQSGNTTIVVKSNGSATIKWIQAECDGECPNDINFIIWGYGNLSGSASGNKLTLKYTSVRYDKSTGEKIVGDAGAEAPIAGSSREVLTLSGGTISRTPLRDGIDMNDGYFYDKSFRKQ